MMTIGIGGSLESFSQSVYAPRRRTALTLYALYALCPKMKSW